MKISKTQSDFLDFSRWMAALLVVAEHARGLVFVDYSKLHLPSFNAKVVYFFSGFGHEAVVIFFVISGYLVGGKAVSSFSAQRFGWKRYVADRATRLYAVLFAALVIGAAFDWCGSRFFNDYGLYDGSSPQRVVVLRDDPVESLTLRAFFVNLLYLQTIAGPTFGSNAPLWSLANEWWYYLLFPLLMSLWFVRTIPKALLSLVLAGLLVWLLQGEILLLFGVWLLGVAASLGNRPLLPWWLAVAALAVALVVMRSEVLNNHYVGSYLVGGSYAALLAALGAYNRSLPLDSLSQHLSNFSYSLYLLHFPMLLFSVSVLYSLSGFGIKEQFGSTSFVLYLVLLAMAIAFARLVALFTEDRTSWLRGLVYRRLGIRGPGNAAPRS